MLSTTTIRGGYEITHICTAFQPYSDRIYSLQELGYQNRISTGACMKMILCTARKSQGQGVNEKLSMMDVLSD